MVAIFPILLIELEISCQDRFRKLSLRTNWIVLLIELYVFGTNYLMIAKTTIA